jgi:hypothetical protein
LFSHSVSSASKIRCCREVIFPVRVELIRF